MMEKLLPIKFFEKRKIDEMSPEPQGGETKPPRWLLTGNDLNQRSQQLTANMAKVSERYEAYKQEGHELPMVMVTTILEDAIAKSHRGEVVGLLGSDNQSSVIGVDSVTYKDAQSKKNTDLELAEDGEAIKEERRILSVVMTDELLANIDKALRNTRDNAKLISTITGMEAYEVRGDDFNPDNKMYRVRLHDYKDIHRNQLAQKLFKNKCEQHGIVIDHETRYSPDMWFYRIVLDSPEDMDTVHGFEGISSIEEAKPIGIDLDSFDVQEVPAVKQPSPNETYPVVGVLDSGIAANSYLAPWLMKVHEEYYGADLQDKSHGSMVASVLEYSDELNGTNFFATPGVMMMEAVIAPDFKKENAYAEDLIDNVRDAVERHKDIKIWTMSAGTDEECDPFSFSEYGMALDNIEDENNVLIIKSAGNSLSFIRNGKYERIAKMADSVRSVVVGSIAGEKGRYDLAEIDMPSPFTRCGPGPGYIVKPDLVAYGGNAGKRPDGNISTTGVKVFNSAGILSSAPGTSFSTPWVARVASELDYLLEGEFDPLLIKALMIHNAGYPAGGMMKMDDKRKLMGFGMPLGTRDILYNSENEITLILRDSLEKKQYIEILGFPFAQSLVGDDGRYHCDITMTVVHSPILRSSEKAEYCQSDIRVAFGTIEGIEQRDTTQPRIKNPLGAISSKNVMTHGLYSKSVFNVLEDEDGSYNKERTLLRYNQKFYPIKKYAVRLDDMTEANKRDCLDGSRQWFMKVEPFYREAILRENAGTEDVLKQEFCIILTIKDPTGKAQVYNEVTQQLQEKNFIYSNVQLRNEIRGHVRLDGDDNG